MQQLRSNRVVSPNLPPPLLLLLLLLLRLLLLLLLLPLLTSTVWFLCRCICSCLAIIVPECREVASCLRLIADCIYCTVQACMTTQVHYELENEDAMRDAAKGVPQPAHAPPTNQMY